MTTDTKRQHTTVRIRADLLSKLNAEAEVRGLSRNALIEQLIAQFLAANGHEVGLRVTL